MWVEVNPDDQQHIGCLTINFDDMRRILDIFFTKAICQTKIESNEST